MENQEKGTSPEEVEYTVAPGEEGKSRNFWQRNGATILPLAILAVVIGSAIFVNERRSKDTPEAAMEEEREKDSASQETPETEKPEENKVSEEKAGELGSGDSTVKKIVGLATAIRVTEETLSDGKTRAVSFEVEALPGEGRTHLARRAIR